jgi:hypothetical protein
MFHVEDFPLVLAVYSRLYRCFPIALGRCLSHFRCRQVFPCFDITIRSFPPKTPAPFGFCSREENLPIHRICDADRRTLGPYRERKCVVMALDLIEYICRDSEISGITHAL